MARRRNRPKKMPRLEECPNCGAPFRAGRLACPECGSDAETGWRDAEDLDYLSVEIPDTYEEMVGGKPDGRRFRRRMALIIVIVVILALTLPLVLRLV